MIRNHTFSLLSSSQCKSTTPSGHLHFSFVNTAEDGTADTLHWGKQFTNLCLLESVIEVLLIKAVSRLFQVQRAVKVCIEIDSFENG